MKVVRKGLPHWQERMAMTVMAFEEVPDTLETFRTPREEAQQRLASVPAKLARMEAEGVPGAPGQLLRAAADTYNQALKEIQEQPANWLRVHDLLADVSACLEQIENPAFGARYRPVRYWCGAIDSPAADALAIMCAAWAAASPARASRASFDGGSSGGGASSDY